MMRLAPHRRPAGNEPAATSALRHGSAAKQKQRHAVIFETADVSISA